MSPPYRDTECHMRVYPARPALKNIWDAWTAGQGPRQGPPRAATLRPATVDLNRNIPYSLLCPRAGGQLSSGCALALCAGKLPDRAPAELGAGADLRPALATAGPAAARHSGLQCTEAPRIQWPCHVQAFKLGLRAPGAGLYSDDARRRLRHGGRLAPLEE